MNETYVEKKHSHWMLWVAIFILLGISIGSSLLANRRLNIHDESFKTVVGFLNRHSKHINRWIKAEKELKKKDAEPIQEKSVQR